MRDNFVKQHIKKAKLVLLFKRADNVLYRSISTINIKQYSSFFPQSYLCISCNQFIY